MAQNPNDILDLFLKHWTGTQDELEEALEEFFYDIADSFQTVATILTTDQIEEVNDYFSNHYCS